MGYTTELLYVVSWTWKTTLSTNCVQTLYNYQNVTDPVAHWHWNVGPSTPWLWCVLPCLGLDMHDSIYWNYLPPWAGISFLSRYPTWILNLCTVSLQHTPLRMEHVLWSWLAYFVLWSNRYHIRHLRIVASVWLITERNLCKTCSVFLQDHSDDRHSIPPLP